MDVRRAFWRRICNTHAHHSTLCSYGTCWTTLSQCCEADGCQSDGTVAARRGDSGDVPQQEAGGLSALSSGGFEFAAGDFVAGHLRGAKGVSKPGDPGPLHPLQDHEIVCWPRSTPRNPLHQVIQGFESVSALWESRVHPLFACIRRIEGVEAGRELTELRRDHDSTGLRAALQLITPLLRCASLAKHTCI